MADEKKPGLYSMRDLLNLSEQEKNPRLFKKYLNNTYPKVPTPLKLQEYFTLSFCFAFSAMY